MTAIVLVGASPDPPKNDRSFPEPQLESVKILAGLVLVVGQSKVALPKPVNVTSRLVKLSEDALIASKHPFVEGAGLPKKREQVLVVKVTGNGTEESTT